MEPDWRQIEHENRGLSVQSAHFLGEGWNSRAYLVNNELVFRFPKRPEHWKELEREVAFLAFAADLLPLAVPRYLHMAPNSPASAYGYSVYRYLHGHAMNVNALPRKKRAQAAESIGAFLRGLHGLHPSAEVGLYCLGRTSAWSPRNTSLAHGMRSCRNCVPWKRTRW
jgi:aminoglycoside 2''-phosphotransferase